MADVIGGARTGRCCHGAAAVPASTPGPDPNTPPETATERAAGMVTAAAVSPLADILAYQQDAWERWILFLDTLRQRADDLLAHDRAGKPPLLDFDYELILDARRFEKPANYALLRITRIADDCIEACLDLSKPPVIIVDPRAGHGPGIGGFKRESEVGIALHEGYPVYFGFLSGALPGPNHCRRAPRLASVRRGGGGPPFRLAAGPLRKLPGGTLLAADCEGLAGPIVLNGSPLSYWASDSGANPMRISGDLFGGAPPHQAEIVNLIHSQSAACRHRGWTKT